MPSMTVTVTTPDNTLLWRRDFPYRGTVGNAEQQQAAAARRVMARKSGILSLFDQPADLKRTDTPCEWRVRAEKETPFSPVGYVRATLGHVRVTFSAQSAPMPSPHPTLKIAVSAETAAGTTDHTADARFADADWAERFAQMVADSGAYAAGGVWLTDANGTRRRIEP